MANARPARRTAHWLPWEAREDAVEGWRRQEHVEARVEALAASLQQARANAARLLDGDPSAEAYLERLDRAVRTHPEHAKRQQRQALAWDKEHRDANAAALAVARRAVPSDVARSSAQGVAKATRAAHARGALRADAGKGKGGGAATAKLLSGMFGGGGGAAEHPAQ